MSIERVIVKNYRTLKDVDIELNPDLNIIVGDNEAGKSTLLEAINLALNCQLNRRPALYELHPFLFNVQTVARFIAGLKNGENLAPPKVLIELFLTDDDGLAPLKGTNNSLGKNACGISLSIELDFENFADEYKEYIEDRDNLNSIPVEYYHIVWDTFAGNPIRAQGKPISCTLIDPSAITNNYGAHKYVMEIVRDYLDKNRESIWLFHIEK
ncbi:AAA family ATPase [Sphingopyxis sp. BSNA05]|uniref:AAA family ATPase n=1 Tax=Sphingopyxis sp. BSNA05 TaxID=1236614 RepID=UPI0020B641DB|nr:AAA family ATPase [Sphingopyxis sp. BSNA05]